MRYVVIPPPVKIMGEEYSFYNHFDRQVKGSDVWRDENFADGIPMLLAIAKKIYANKVGDEIAFSDPEFEKFAPLFLMKGATIREEFLDVLPMMTSVQGATREPREEKAKSRPAKVVKGALENFVAEAESARDKTNPGA